MGETSLELLRGTLDVLILKTLSWGPMHGYGVADWIRQRTGEAILVEEGALYPALHRLEKRGWLAADWGRSESGRQVKLYELTAGGRRQLEDDSARWHEHARAVTTVLQS